MITQYAFYFLSFLGILCGLMVVLSKNPVHSVLYLVIAFFAIAGHYLLLNAQFLAAVHIIVYTGAIMVLFLYIIMMLNLNKESEPQKSVIAKIVAVVSAGVFMLVLVGSLRGAEMITGSAPNANIGLVKNIGKVLFGEFMLPFEISSILFLAGMVGAVLLGKKETE